MDDGRWGVFLCEKYWKFKDKPVMYSAAVNRELAQKRVDRLNNPGFYENDEKYVSVGAEREAKKRAKMKKKND